MDSWDLKKWRKKHRFNQFEAAQKLGTNRSGIQDLEREVRPIWKSIELACEEITRLELRRPEYGPVTLLCTLDPILQMHDGPYQVVSLHCEKYLNNEAAIGAAIEGGFYLERGDALILADDGFVVWETAELRRECKRRKEII